jgi:septal ring factor EnvC (AmiA/AmiB activator)
MPAKKAPTMTRAARAAVVIDRWATMENDLALLERELKSAQAHLAELHKQVAAEKTSVEFWTYEVSRWRKEAEDLRREDAMARVERGEH